VEVHTKLTDKSDRTRPTRLGPHGSSLLPRLSALCFCASAAYSRWRFVMSGIGSAMPQSCRRRPISVPVRPVSVAPRMLHTTRRFASSNFGTALTVRLLYESPRSCACNVLTRRDALSEPGQAPHEFPFDQRFELLAKLPDELRVSDHDASLDVSFHSVKFADVRKAAASSTTTHLACHVARRSTSSSMPRGS